MDEREITRLLYDYCRGLDTMDLELATSMFTEDCDVDFGPASDMRVSGSRALKDWLAMLWQWTRTAHQLSNVQLWFDSETAARGLSYVIAWHELPDGSSTTLYGQYHDRFVRTENGWRIIRRELRMSGSTQNWHIGNHRLDRAPAPDDASNGPGRG